MGQPQYNKYIRISYIEMTYWKITMLWLVLTAFQKSTSLTHHSNSTTTALNVIRNSIHHNFKSISIKSIHNKSNIKKDSILRQLHKHTTDRTCFDSTRRRYYNTDVSTSSSSTASSSTNRIDDNERCHHYIFGYGSLICSNSRSISVPEQANKVVTPVVVKGVQAVWSKRVARGMTALGVKVIDDYYNETQTQQQQQQQQKQQQDLQKSNSLVSSNNKQSLSPPKQKFPPQCVGVLLPVNDTELEKFDEREQGYQRKLIRLDHVETLPFLEHTKYYSHPNQQVFIQAKERFIQKMKKQKEEQQQQQELPNDDADDNNDEPMVKVWMYVPEEHVPPSMEYPIVQSYVDTILRGCLSISEQFAHEFIQSTMGWHPDDFIKNPTNNKNNRNKKVRSNENNNLDTNDNSINSIQQDVANHLFVDSISSLSSSSSPSSSSSSSLLSDSSFSSFSSYFIDDRIDPIYIRGDPTWSRLHATKVDQLLQTCRPWIMNHRKPRSLTTQTTTQTTKATTTATTTKNILPQ